MARVTAAMVASGRTIGEPRLSSDASTVAFVATVGGRATLTLVPAGGGPEVVVTTDPLPRSARSDSGGVFDWLPDGSALVYVSVDGGLWLQPTAGGPPQRVVAPHADGAAGAPAVSPDGTRVAYVVDQQHVAVAELDGRSWPVRLSDGNDFALDPSWSPDSSRVAWHEWDVPAMPWDGSRIALRGAGASGSVEVVAGGPGVAVAQPRWSADGRLGFLCDSGGWMNVHTTDGPVVDEPVEHGPPAWGHGIRTWSWSPDGVAVAWTRSCDGFGELVVDGDVVARGVHHGLSWRGDRLAAVRSGARTPTQIVVHDLASTGPDRTTVARGPVAGWEALDLPEPEVLRWTCDDGAVVVGRLYEPAAAAIHGVPPLLCWVHGGPTGQRQVTFDARAAWFLDRGWALLVPDHRGSTGHGRAYTQAMTGRWGELDVADCAAGVRHVLAAGRGDPERVAAMGGSAGGLTTLLLLAHHAELFAAGVALSAVADIVDLGERSHRFERHYNDSLVGPLPAAWNLQRDRSPLSVAERISAPLLLLHGRDDEVVPVDQAIALADRLRGLGRDVELHVYDGEGHGWSRPDTVVDELTRVERFLHHHVLRTAG
jgi:dipeptidyl aminopeptidase/acylaminoacyl peptidase